MKRTERFIGDPGADEMLVRPMRTPWHTVDRR